MTLLVARTVPGGATGVMFQGAGADQFALELREFRRARPPSSGRGRSSYRPRNLPGSETPLHLQPLPKRAADLYLFKTSLCTYLKQN
jgi:hypothetical protein